MALKSSPLSGSAAADLLAQSLAGLAVSGATRFTRIP